MTAASHTVRIDAPIEKVWAAFMDVERWPEFAPQFKSIVRSDDGQMLAQGKTARVTPHGFPGAVWTVTRFEEGRSFLWEADLVPGLHLAADHVLEPDGDGTKATLALDSSGLLAPIASLAAGRVFRRNVRQEAEGLKAYCEGS